MNLVIKIFLLLIIESSFCILNAQENHTTLNIRTNADSAGLIVDNNFIEVGNEFQIEVETGVHLIQLVKHLKIWNTEIITDTINIEDSKELFFTFTFNNQTQLNTNPQDVSVSKNDSLIGFTPILLEAGFEALELQKPGYKSTIITAEEISNGKIPELLFIGQPPAQQFYGSTLFKVLLGTAIALGAASAYYKLEADKLYEEYKSTGDPGLVDNIDHYDGQSAGTFIAMEICVGALIYFFLTY